MSEGVFLPHVVSFCFVSLFFFPSCSSPEKQKMIRKTSGDTVDIQVWKMMEKPFTLKHIKQFVGKFESKKSKQKIIGPHEPFEVTSCFSGRSGCLFHSFVF